MTGLGGRTGRRVGVVALWVAMQAVWLVPETPGAGVVYRFRPGSPGLSSAYVSENVEIGPFLDQRELAARGPGGWGLLAPYSAEFAGTASTFRSDGIGPSNQPLGPRLTVEAWFRASSVAGEVSLLTNRAPAGDGFLLGLDAGIPFFEMVSGAAVFRVEGTVPLGANEDHWLAGTARYDGGGTLHVTLYVDGESQDEMSSVTVITSPYVINAPFYVGTRVEGNPLAPTLVGALTGHMYLAVVRDYVANPLYLNSSVPFDGGEYFGLPAYHDYPLDEFHVPMDQRMSSEPVEVRQRFFIPYANDEYIPQGMATRDDGGDQALLYVSYYHRTREDVIQSQRSIVAEMDAATGHVRRTFRLRGQLEYSHAGGVAYAHEALFISSVGYVERYPVPAYEGPDGPRYIDLDPDPSGSISVQSKASYVSSFEDTLWVGDWRTSSDVAPFLYAYPLKPDGRPESSAAEIYALPRNVQGVDLIRHNGQVYVFLSRNRNSREAEVLRYRRELLDRNVVATEDTSVTMPFGIEDLSFRPDGTLWTSSESGTVYYQRNDTSPWLSFYPFVYSVPASVLLPGSGSVGVVSPPIPGRAGFDIQAYPNPVRDSARITITLPRRAYGRIYVADILGRLQTVLSEGQLESGMLEMTWIPGTSAPGVYFAVLESPSGRWVRPLVVVR